MTASPRYAPARIETFSEVTVRLTSGRSVDLQHVVHQVNPITQTLATIRFIETNGDQAMHIFNMAEVEHITMVPAKVELA